VTNPAPPGGARYVGPYRIEGQLGRGGMGEVYAGFDERLDRPVALKRIWSGWEEDATARKRFQREARAVARLHHPAIVQVYDWVESGDGDWIVMELVEGWSLRQLLREGPLAPGRAARLARDVLVGLAVAHAGGIVHRDLKAENVMIAADSSPGKVEQAKILDFGLAKRVDPENSETRLSSDGGLVGTLSAMSPEQVRGGEVGPRSDLFALGSLLYEMVTGATPFRGDSAAEVLQRICTWDPPPARSVIPVIPEALSAFLAHLLEKDPRKRPHSAEDALAELDAVLKDLPALPTVDTIGGSLAGRAFRTAVDRPVVPIGPAGPVVPGVLDVPGTAPRPGRRGRLRWLIVAGVVALGLLAAAGAWLRPPPRTLYVAVPETTVTASGDTGQDLGLAASGVRTALLQGLLGFRHVAALEPSRDEAAAGDPVALARVLAADEVLTSRLECGPRTCRLELRRLRGADGRLLWTTGFTVAPGSLLEMGLAVVEHLRAAFPEARLRSGVPDLEVRAEDYEAYLRLKGRFDNREQGFSTDDLLAGLERLEGTSPRFLDPPLYAAAALVQRFEATRDRADLERAAQAVERARSKAPEDPRVLAQQATVARVAGRLDEAEAVLERLRRLEPGNAQLLQQKAFLVEIRGQRQEAVKMMREVIQQLPSAASHFNLGSMLYRHGDVDGARRELEAGLALAPRHYNGLSHLAQLELASGDTKRAAALYEKLVSLSPESTELTNLGTAYLLVGRYADAARRFREALKLAPGSPSALLNLADAEFLVGRRQEAFALYRQVLEQVDRDPQPEKLLTVRAQALAHLHRSPEAVAAVQEALRLDPESPYRAYEASLVVALVGDETSALWNARRALDRGFDPRWFAFPWFDPLRARLAGMTQQAGRNQP
jgi:tetratricopeptide (TPR) repeat protein